MKFLDQCKIYVRSGAGGAGCISFRREKYVPRGGPDGGDGGRGGHVWAHSVSGLNTLIDFRYRQHIQAKTGGHGQGRKRSGADAPDIVLDLPVGSQIFEGEPGESMIADLDCPGKTVLLAQGGSGGWGNARFTSSTNRAPRRANPGLAGQERLLWLRLKLLADAGLIGRPNAGKSTFLAAVSAARPKIAPYPFTTLFPHLGVARLDRETEIVLADIPGLIEGAASGAGLGTRFLGHIERCAVLLHLIDATEEHPGALWSGTRKELHAYGAGLQHKAELVVLNKIDAVDSLTLNQRRAELAQACGAEPLLLSGVSGDGVQSALGCLLRMIRCAASPVDNVDNKAAAPAWAP